MKELNAIRSALKVPKGQMNSFGGYKYRSCEDILEAVKPLLTQHNACLTITDDMVQLGDRYYVKAIVTFSVEKESISVSAHAREAESKKGMDEAQITGATSSYARKYALNGLLAIDDTKDADSMDNTEKTPTKVNSTAKKATPAASDMPETEEMRVRAAEISDDFHQSTDLMDLESKVAKHRVEINTKMSKQYKIWLVGERQSAKEKIEETLKGGQDE